MVPLPRFVGDTMKIRFSRGSSPLASVLPAALGLTLLGLALGPPSSKTGALLAQDAEVATRGGKKVLTIDDYARWRSIGQTSISPDGQWVTYAYSQREVDDSLFIKEVAGGEPATVVRGSDPEFSKDSRWVAYHINPPEEENGGGRGSAGGGGGGGSNGRGGSAADRPPRAVELRDLQTGETRKWDNADSFGFAEAGRAFMVKKRANDSDAEHKGTDLIVRYLDSGMEELIGYVNEYAADQPGMRVAYTVDGPDGESNGVQVLALDTRVRTVLDAEREATYTRLTWGGDPDEEVEPAVDALAVLKGKDDDDLAERENAVLLWPVVSAAAAPLVLDPRPADDDEADEADEYSESPDDPSPSDAIGGGFPSDRVMSEKGPLRWSPDATRLFVETRPQLPSASVLCESPKKEGGETDDEGEADSANEGPKIVNLATRVSAYGRPLGPEEVTGGVCPEFIADVDIWHVRDERIQSIQEARANTDRNRTYAGVVHVEGGGALRFVQLADETMETVEVSDDGRSAIGADDRAYRSDWQPNYRDVFVVDIETGERTLILERQLRTLGLDPHGEHYLYWMDGNVWSYDLEAEKHGNLSADAPVTFENAQFDRFGDVPPYGVAGWTTDGDAIVMHRHDLYRFSPDGGAPENLTRGFGQENEIRLRLIDTDPDEDEFDLSKHLYLSAYGEWTKKAGFYRLEGGELEELVFDGARYGNLTKAQDADVAIFTRQDFETFPDYWLSDLDHESPVRITSANPQQEEYNWGRRILFDYQTSDGVRKQGTLAIPDDYQEGERRPMLINYYEQNSQNLHSYPTPRYQGSPNFAGYVSEGYLVMQPDIHFRIGPSHQHMLESIELALDAVIEMGYVDPDRVALHGHSYSGQGSTYIATHSDRFAAIVAGAAATNLVSDFNALWGRGNNAHNYDIYGQGRLGTDLYSDFDLYVDQSAVHHAADMNTPLLLLHGEDDPTVRWMHSVEFYNGLRWFGKEVILLSYPGEGHGLRQYENQKDFQIRTRQFINHHLRGAPTAVWMESGRNFIQKERALEMMKKKGEEGGSGPVQGRR
jgi:dipeptidyl aminopeptidase/acylaminoacyl peptidase